MPKLHQGGLLLMKLPRLVFKAALCQCTQATPWHGGGLPPGNTNSLVQVQVQVHASDVMYMCDVQVPCAGVQCDVQVSSAMCRCDVQV